MTLGNESILKMHELRKREENEEEVLIGRPDISNFVILPTFAVEIIEMLDRGSSVGEVAAIMEERFGEPVDVLDFANDLIHEYQFVYLADGIVVNEKVQAKDHFPWISEKVGNFFFNRVAFVLYAVLFLSGIALCFYNSRYFPSYEDVFISSSVTVSLVVTLVANWFFLFLHEMAHLTAARSLGIGSRIGLGHRLFFMVAETNMSNIVLVRPNRRYRAFFAGMAWDCSLLGIGLWLLYGQDAGWFSLSAATISFIKMFNLTFLWGLAFQLMFYMKTDIYYAFTTKFNCNNLLENTVLYLRTFYRKHTEAEQNEWSYIAEQEKRVVRWYAWVYLVGIVWSVYIFCAYILRMTIEFIVRVYDGMLEHGIMSWQFVDGVLLIVLTLIPSGIVVWSWTRSWKARRVATVQKGYDPDSFMT
jgi:hypothetical protein